MPLRCEGKLLMNIGLRRCVCFVVHALVKVSIAILGYVEDLVELDRGKRILRTVGYWNGLQKVLEI